MELKTCHHSFDNGSFCQSPAVRGRAYCCYHLRHRGRLMRMARFRSRNERIFLTLPPLENMHAVQSALSQVLEAVAADMIDLKRAQFLLTGLRHAASNFKNPQAWKPSAYLHDPSAPSVDEYPNFEAEYGLPEDLDLATSPEVAFPPPPEPVCSDSSSRHEGAPPLSPLVGDRVGFDAVGPAVSPEPLPTIIETTPADIELEEVLKNYGYKVWEARVTEHERSQRRRDLRRRFRANYARYEAEAKARNIRAAARQLANEMLAAEKAAAETPSDVSTAQKKPPAGAVGTPQSAQKERPKTA